ncbi:hypothetical protein HUG15_17900 [Salicibibacter cibarius]|uniref:Uncharacterized protein n=1 Tax=Salicibibacter cibarius TaxID=2743000 RepID=A0A7T7CCR5_9BACI|nr:hypothetical protein HUG15_17900 [Salicibibacter cibarius]
MADKSFVLADILVISAHILQNLADKVAFSADKRSGEDASNLPCTRHPLFVIIKENI